MIEQLHEHLAASQGQPTTNYFLYLSFKIKQDSGRKVSVPYLICLILTEEQQNSTILVQVQNMKQCLKQSKREDFVLGDHILVLHTRSLVEYVTD